VSTDRNGPNCTTFTGDDPSNRGRVTGNYHDNHIKRCGKVF
jgi:hypothetical protein